MEIFPAVRRALGRSDLLITDRILDVVSIKLILYAIAAVASVQEHAWPTRNLWIPHISIGWNPESIWKFGLLNAPSVSVGICLPALLLLFSIAITRRRRWGMVGGICLTAAMGLTYLSALSPSQFQHNPSPLASLFFQGVAVAFVAITFSFFSYETRARIAVCCACFLMAVCLSTYGFCAFGVRLSVLWYSLAPLLTAAALAIGLIRFLGEVTDGRRPAEI
jgi:hypothetical protein